MVLGVQRTACTAAQQVQHFRRGRGRHDRKKHLTTITCTRLIILIDTTGGSKSGLQGFVLEWSGQPYCMYAKPWVRRQNLATVAESRVGTDNRRARVRDHM